MKLCQWLALIMAGVLLVFGTGMASADNGSISGTVYGENGVTPVTGDETIRVALFDHDFPHSPLMEVPVNPVHGTYVFEGLSAGHYDLRVLAQNYIDVYWTAEGSVYYRHQLETIILQDGQQFAGIDFQLTPGTSLTGTVYAADGTTPIDGALHHVDICALVDSCGSMWEFCSQMETNGAYTIQLPSATFFVTVFSEDYIPELWAPEGSVRDCADAQQIEISEGSPVSGIDFQLERGVTVSGTVFHWDGVTPIAGDPLISVGLVRDNPCLSQGNDFSGSLNTTDGTFTSLVEPGTYYLGVSAKNYVDEFWSSPASVYSCADAQMITVVADEPLSGLDFQLAPGNVISGTVYEPGGTAPLVNQEYLGIEITTQNPCAIDYATSAEFFTFVDTSFGTWAVHVPDGTYYVLLNTGSHDTNQFWAEPISVGTMDCDQARTLTVAGNNSYGNINFNKAAEPDRIFWTQVDVNQGNLGAGFDILPGYLHLLVSATVTGPEGFVYEFDLQNDVFSRLNECNYMIAWWHEFGSAFDYGQYTVTIFFKDGIQETQTFDLQQVNVTAVDTGSMSHTVNDGGSIDFSWTNPDPGQKYQLRIYQDGERVYSSNVSLDMDQIQVSPENLRCLVPGGNAVWEVRAYDNNSPANAIQKSGQIPVNYTPSDFGTDNYRFQVSKVQGDPDRLGLYFTLRPGSRHLVTRAAVTGPDDFSDTFELVDDWYDISTETMTNKGWWRERSAETDPIADGEYTLTVELQDGTVEILTSFLAADTLTPVDAAAMDHEILQNGDIRFFWTLPPGIDGQTYSVSIQNKDGSAEYVRTGSSADITEQHVSARDLRALPRGGTFSWFVRAYDAQRDTWAQSDARYFTYNPYNITVPGGDTFILTADTPDLIMTRGHKAHVYGTAASNSVTLENGASAELINFPGSNAIRIISDAGLFTVSRTGTMVRFEGPDGTVCKIPATTRIQTIVFNDRSLVLQIHDNLVKLDDQVIGPAPEPIL